MKKIITLALCLILLTGMALTGFAESGQAGGEAFAQWEEKYGDRIWAYSIR